MPRAVYVEPPGALPSSIEYSFGQSADGPDYGVGHGSIPIVEWSGFINQEITITQANYGKIGPTDVRGNKPQRNINLDVSANPVNSPTFNSATPTGLFHLKVDNAQQFARWQVNAMATDPGIPAPIPIQFESAGAATLYSGT